MSASEFVLKANQRVTTYGRIEWRANSNPLLHVALWPSRDAVRVTSGAVEVLDGPDNMDEHGGLLVGVSGAWDPSGAIRVEKLRSIAEVPALPAAWGDEESLARAATLSNDESVSIYRSARKSACGLSLATAGGRSHLMVIKVLHICSDIAYWHEQEGHLFMTLAPAIVPEGVELSAPPFIAARTELKAFGLSH